MSRLGDSRPARVGYPVAARTRRIRPNRGALDGLPFVHDPTVLLAGSPHAAVRAVGELLVKGRRALHDAGEEFLLRGCWLVHGRYSGVQS